MFLLFCLGICCSYYFKQIDDVLKSRLTLSLAALLCVAFPQVKYINLSEIVRLVKAVALLRSLKLK